MGINKFRQPKSLTDKELKSAQEHAASLRQKQSPSNAVSELEAAYQERGQRFGFK